MNHDVEFEGLSQRRNFNLPAPDATLAHRAEIVFNFGVVFHIQLEEVLIAFNVVHR